MIPKKIHYVWLGGDIPPKTQSCIDSWKRILPDYEIVKWNTDNFDVDSVKWVKQAVKHKKWAFASDYIRLYAIYNYGGVYLDGDVELLRPFGNELMELPYFLGMEKTREIVGTATFGAKPETEWIKEVLNFYDGKDFSQITIPSIMLKTFKRKYGLRLIANPSEFNRNEERIQILPPDFFAPKRWNDNFAVVTNNTRTIHHFEGSWTNVKNNLARKAKNKIADLIGQSFYTKIMFNLFARGK